MADSHGSSSSGGGFISVIVLLFTIAMIYLAIIGLGTLFGMRFPDTASSVATPQENTDTELPEGYAWAVQTERCTSLGMRSVINLSDGQRFCM